MTLLVFTYVLIALGGGLLNLGYADRLRKTYDAPFLNTWFHYLSAFNLSNFLNWVSYKVVALFFSGGGGLAAKQAYLLAGFFDLPIALASMFFFLLLLVKLSGRRIPRWLTLTLAGGGLVVVSHFFRIYAAGFHRDPVWVEASWAIFDSLGILLVTLLPAAFLIDNLFQKDGFLRRRNREIMLALQALVVIVYLVPLPWLQPVWGGVTVDLLVFLMFFLPLVPLRIAEAHLRRALRLYPPPPEAAVDWPVLGREFGISHRECEVLALLYTGSSARDIEAALFISERTVRSHLYSAYRKLGVKNRLQLVNLLRHLKTRPST